MTAIRKNETVTFRIDAATQELIQRAAKVSGKSVSAFVIEAASSAAQKELLEQRFVGMDAEVFDRVDAMLSEPGKANSALVKLFKSNTQWLD